MVYLLYMFIDLLLITYVFCYHFELDDPLIQLTENYKWIHFFDFYWRFGIDGLSLGPLLLTGFITTLATLSAQPITRESKLFYFLMLAMYSGQLGTFFFSRHLTFFHHVGIRINSRLSTFIYVGWKKTFVFSYKVYFVHWGSSIFLLLGILGMGFYSSNEPTLNFESLSNQSYPMALEIIFYMGFLIAFALKSLIPLHTCLLDTHGEAHYSTCMLLAGILLKMGAYGLVRINMELLSHAHSIFCPWLMLLGSISWSTQCKKKNSLFLGLSYGFLNFRNWFYKRDRAEWGYFTNNLSRIYWCCPFFLGGN